MKTIILILFALLYGCSSLPANETRGFVIKRTMTMRDGSTYQYDEVHHPMPKNRPPPDFVVMKKAEALCTVQATQTYYIASEKVLNHGNTEKMMAFLAKSVSKSELRVMSPPLLQLSHWVDAHDYATAREYQQALFIECIKNSRPSIRT